MLRQSQRGRKYVRCPEKLCNKIYPETFVAAHKVDCIDSSGVSQIVKEALKKYDADKTGRVDYALESAGRAFFRY